MKALLFLTAITVGGAVFFFNGGSDMLGFGQPVDLPETIHHPDLILQDSADDNPFFEK